MTTKFYVVDEKASLARCPIDRIDKYGESEIGFVELVKPGRKGFRDLLCGLVPQELQEELIHEAQSSSHVALYGNALLLRMPVAVSKNKSAGLTIVMVDRTVVIIRQDDIPILDEVIAQLQNRSMQSPHAAFLLFEIVDMIVDNDTVAALALRRRVDALEQELDEVDREFDLDGVSDCRRDAVLLEAVMEDQRSCLGGLQTTSMQILRAPDFQAVLRDTISHLDHNIRVAGRVEDRLDALQQHYILTLQDRQNSRLQLLTVVSAIFLPLTLITGIYGMNFRYIPELSWRFGYGFVLLFMLGIAAVLLYALYRREWFR